MKALLVVFGVLAAVVVGLVALFTLGEGAAVLVFILIVGLTVGGFFAPKGIMRGLAAAFAVMFLAASTFAAVQTLAIIDALSTTEGPVDSADASALASINAKVDAIDQKSGFRLELTEAEMTAYILDGLQDNEDNPLQRIEIDITGVTPNGELTFDAQFKSGDLSATGAVTATLDAGSVQLELQDIDMGALSLPGAGRGALEDLIAEVADLNDAIDENRASIQSISVGDDRIVVTGVQAGGSVLTAETLLTSISEQVAAASASTSPPPERLGPGVVDGVSADGSTYYVALGDSLASNYGEAARDGYVSRFHNALQQRDGASYGLRNFGISGESSGTLLRSGQLDTAVAFMESNDVSFVSIDMGGNDLLGHLGEADCAADVQSVSCQERIDSSMVTYEENMVRVFDALTDAAPDATIILLETYNPFSFGFASAVAFEAESDRAISEMNAIAARLAAERGIIVADGFSPMMGTVAITTHMADGPPDIHPTPIGFDVLASALLDALG